MLQDKDYMIFQHIEQETRWFGFTPDELIPMIVLSLIGILSGYPITGIFLAAGWFTLVRAVKQGLGVKYLIALAYWYLPGIKVKQNGEEISLGLFTHKTPPADLVHWI